MNSDSEHCTTDDIYPFVLTYKAGKAVDDALRYGHGDARWDDCCASNTECCWCCFPCTLAIDLVTLIPFSGIYFGKKCTKFCKKDKVEITPIPTQPAEMPTRIVTQPDKI